MHDKALTRAHLSEAVYQQIGLSLQESAHIVDKVFDEIAEALIKGDSVTLSTFGSFNIRQKKQRMGRNPKTGELIPITARSVLTFKVSSMLKEKVNKNLSAIKNINTLEK
ncbi:MAG: integration host factor subunit alpha [Alphaproteobacteria bacterium]|nr:integration host factor subunit alpha [Alphaproteobacteria bacterium]